MTTHSLKQMAIAVLKTEAQSITDLISRVDEQFVNACQSMLKCKGRIVVTGIGKSGHIGSKIAATLASTGTPAFFMHPGDASHGDLGMITAQDIVIALSNSGNTYEIVSLLPLIKRLGIVLIAMTGNANSTLAKQADIHLDTHVKKEACPLGLAPTASSTAALAMGDALAIALLDTRGFTEQDFARSHPGGQLGKQLLLRVSDIMQTGNMIPRVTPDVQLGEAVMEITRAGIGITAVVDNNNQVIGTFTDGDLRRALERKVDFHSTSTGDLMTSNCTTIQADELAVQCLKIMQEKRINALLVIDLQQQLVGALNIHHLLRAGVA